MATPAQLLANRANAQKSTGPRSVEGKAASRFNALKHGLDARSIVLPGEDPAEYETLAREYDSSMCPETATERFHVDTMNLRFTLHLARMITGILVYLAFPL